MFKPRTMRNATTGATWLAVSAMLALSGCSSAGKLGESVGSLGGMLTPYRSDVLQGNVVTREQVQALQRGSSAQAAEQGPGSLPPMTKMS